MCLSNSNSISTIYISYNNVVGHLLLHLAIHHLFSLSLLYFQYWLVWHYSASFVRLPILISGIGGISSSPVTSSTEAISNPWALITDSFRSYKWACLAWFWFLDGVCCFVFVVVCCWFQAQTCLQCLCHHIPKCCNGWDALQWEKTSEKGKSILVMVIVIETQIPLARNWKFYQ